MSNITLTIIKPDAVKDGNIGAILDQIEKGGFRIKALRMKHLSKQEAQAFYAVHKERPFYGELVDYMISGPVVPCVLEGENAVAAFRKLIGATNPEQAEEGTVRKRFGKSLQSNAIHGSDSDENAAIEAAFFFPAAEIY
ncbi:MAG: nucleoside-diphosphate kinase [Sphingobacteriales bacterium]|nr:MAG: nucleoside-diphosphate kinase [Sphingobacteriales bacterium]